MPSVTLSSVGTATLNTDYLGAKTTSVAVRFTSSTSSDVFSVQATLDDPMVIASSNRSWFTLSSATIISTTSFDSGYYLPILTPVAAVRINSSVLSSGSIVLQVLQNAGG